MGHDGRAVHPDRHGARAADPHLGRSAAGHDHVGDGVGEHALLGRDGGVEIDRSMLVGRLDHLPLAGLGRPWLRCLGRIGLGKPYPLSIVKLPADPPLPHEPKHLGDIHLLAML